jgi:phospholipid/cholesterol/gamma-HCH transport system substrate-binding protein
MAENPTEIVAGALTLVVAGGFFAFAAQTTGLPGAGQESYPLSASFRSAQGVTTGTDVRLAGVRVGRVTALELNQVTYRADLALAIDADVDVPEDSAAAVSAEGLLGGTFVEILPGGSPFALDPGSEIVDTRSAVSLFGLLSQIIAAGAGD